MKRNTGKADGLLRIFTAIVISLLVVPGLIKGTPAIILVILSVVFAIAAFTGFCPVNRIFGFRTNQKDEQHAA